MKKPFEPFCKKKDLDYIGFDSKTNRLLFFGAQDDFDEEIEFKSSFLKKYDFNKLLVNLRKFFFHILFKGFLA
jgi:hypothetical protein